MAEIDWTEESDAGSGGSIEGLGWMVGPYVVARLHENLILDAHAAWGRSDNDISPLGTYTDTFATDRWLAEAKLTGDFRQGALRFSPQLGILYFGETQHAYTDSLDAAIGEQTVELGRLKLGPRVSYVHQMADGTEIEPSLLLHGIWDFRRADIVDLTTGLPLASANDNLRARLEAGVAIRLPAGAGLALRGFIDGIGVDGFDAYGGSARVNIPLD